MMVQQIYQKEILEKFQKEDERIIIVNKCNGGYGSSCNAGLNLAKKASMSALLNLMIILIKICCKIYIILQRRMIQILLNLLIMNSKMITILLLKSTGVKEYKMPVGVFEISDCTQLVYFHPSIWSCIYKKSFLDRNNIRFVEAKGAGWADNPFQIQTLCLAKRIFIRIMLITITGLRIRLLQATL